MIMRQKILTPRVPPFKSLKVIETDTDRCAAYDFLLVLHSNHEPISYNFRDRRRNLLKIANFSQFCVFNAPMGVPLGIS